jgi:hypothetical protein
LSGQECVGFLDAERPTAHIDYGVGGADGGRSGAGTRADLTLSATSDHDLTLVVRTPAGDFLCNDDADGSLDPRLTVRGATTGRYTVWVGNWESGAAVPGLLAISESGARAAPSTLEPTGTPRSGVVRLEAGFAPDPRRHPVTAGGVQRNPLEDPACVGHLTTGPPTVRLDFQAGRLPLTIGARAEDDLNLVVRLPDGRFVCDDDGGEGVDPRIVVDRPPSGSYAIWVGTWERTPGGVAAELTFSELGRGPER